MLLTDKSFDLEDFELKIVSYALERFQGNKSKTAEFLKITRNQLYTWLQKIR
jgi:DNA-binding NtrC family response regulator